MKSKGLKILIQRSLALGLFICLFPFRPFSQNLIQKSRDSIALSFSQKPALIGGLDSRHTFISKRQINLLGARAGLQWGRRFRFSLGYYFMENPFYLNEIKTDGDTIQSKLGFSYFALIPEYVLFLNNRWELSMPLYLGFGQSNLSKERRGFIMPIEFSLNGSYRILSWMGLSAGAGYRFLPFKNPNLNEKFHNPVYTLGIRFFFDSLLNMAKKRRFQPLD